MKAKILADTLSPVLNQAAGAVGKESGMDHLYVAADGDQVRLMGRNEKLMLKVGSVAEDVMAEGSCTLPAKKAADVVKALPAGAEITIENDPETHKVKVRSGKSQFTMSGINPDDIPGAHIPSDEYQLTVNTDTFHHLLRQASYAMAKDDVRTQMNGTYLAINGEGMEAASTDGHRLGVARGPAATGSFEGTLPFDAVKFLDRQLADQGDSELRVSGNQNLIRFQVNGMELIASLVAEKFLDYRRVIPERQTEPVSVDRGDLLAAVRRVSLMAPEKNRGMGADFQAGTLILFADRPKDDEAGSESMELAYQGEHVRIGFNADYMIQALSHLGGDEALLHVKDGQSAILIEPSGEQRGSEDHVVMPMRL